jgi:Tfp pilus assembly protein PilV
MRTLFHAFNRRRGISVLEVSAASVVLIMAFMLLAQMLVLIARHERNAEAREVALREVANQLEVALARSWEDWKIGELQELTPAKEVLALLPTAKLTTQVSAGEDADSKQLRMELTWKDSTGEFVSPVSLVAWKHRPRREGQP